MAGRPSHGILEDVDRIDFERRRLPLRAAVIVAPFLLLPTAGVAALPTVLTIVAAGICSFVLVWLLTSRFQGLLLRLQLGVRLLDVCLMFAFFFGARAHIPPGSFDAIYMLPVLAGAATHGRQGTTVVTVAATAAVLVIRLFPAAGAPLHLGIDDFTSAASYALIFAVSGQLVTVFMEKSGEVVERRERGLRQALAERNYSLERSTYQLTAANRELEAFAYSVSHDLRAPLRSIDGFSRVLEKNHGQQLDAEGQDYLRRIRNATQRMGTLIDDLLKLSRLTRMEMTLQPVDLSAMAATIIAELRDASPDRKVEAHVQEGLVARGDPQLLQVALANLLGNAWKFTSKLPHAVIDFGAQQEGERTIYFVGDNGAGFDMAYAEKLFGAFQRLHSAGEFEGTGIGLATVQRIVHRHGGEIWAESAVDQGTTMYFTL